MKMRIYDFLSKQAKRGETFTIGEAYEITHKSKPYLRKNLYRLEKMGAIERVERGEYILTNNVKTRQKKRKMEINCESG